MYIYICTQACINLCGKFIKLYTHTCTPIYIDPPSLLSSFSNTNLFHTQLLPSSIHDFSASANSKHLLQDRYICAYRYVYL